MKVVVFSDAHGYHHMIDKIIAFNPQADYYISLGDSELDDDYFIRRDILNVRGNYPRDPGYVYDRELDVEGTRLFITHGHRYKVHRSLEQLGKHALENNFDIALYGHTHILHVETVGPLTMINPGSLRSPRSSFPPSYCILYIENKTLQIEFRNADTNDLLEVNV